MSGECVIGLQWGDEAKGKIVDLLTASKEIVVRYQGGANAGHTVVVGDETYKLHLIPSGILNPNVINVVTGGTVIHPFTLLGEIESIVQRGHSIDGRLLLSDRAHVVFPWHVVEDRLWNDRADAEDSIGTTLRGIGPCYRDKVGRSFAIRLGDLLRDDLESRIRDVLQFKRDTFASFVRPDNEPAVDELDADEICEQYRSHAEQLRPYICDTTDFLLSAAEQGKQILFEGAQGALLDIDHGTFPFVTSSNSSGAGVSAGSGIPAKWISKVLGVAKCYTTRVGGGPFPTELDDAVGEHLRTVGKEFGTTTGRPRRCGWFDAVAVRYTARLSGVDTLAMMMIDVLSGLEQLQICVAYELDGHPIERFPSHVDDLRRVQPIYETLPGWQQDITGAKTMDDLPTEAVGYLQRISQLLERDIEFVSVGPERTQTIDCQTADQVRA